MDLLTETKTCLSCKYLSPIVLLGKWSECEYPVKYPACATDLKNIVLGLVHREHPKDNCECWEHWAGGKNEKEGTT